MDLTNWQYHEKKIINHTRVDEDLSDFPVFVKLDSSNFDFSKAKSDGTDVVFVDVNDNLLAFERVSYDSTAQIAEFWVKIPSVSSTVDTEFYMYYGNSDATDQQNATGVWDDNYIFVSHMKDDPDASHIKDSTANGNNGSKTTAGNPAEADGKIGKAQDFDGSSNEIDVPDSTIFDTGGQNTVELLFKTNVQNQNYIGLILHNLSDYKYLMYLSSNSGRFVYYVKTASGVTGASLANGDNYYADNTWRYMAGTYNRTLSSQRVKLYQNGALVVTADGYDEDIEAGDEGLTIGQWDSYYFAGLLDEIRISKIARSAAWVKATYYTEFNALLRSGEVSTNAIMFGMNF